MDFSEFGLDSRLQDGLKDCAYTECTPVQEAVLKAALDGSNLYVQSQTGTGKTCAYVLPILQEILAQKAASENAAQSGENTSQQDKRGSDTRGAVLILLPTRELAVQVTEEASALAAHTGLKASCFYGGVGYDKQLAAIKSGVDIIVGTPGRMIDLNEGGQLDLSHIKYLVIDEADRMFDMGFYPDLRTLLKVLPAPEARQTMLLSATLNTYVKNLAWEFTRDAKEITIQSENITVDQIDQELLHVSSDDKMKLLAGILTKKKPQSVLIFCNTKRTCEVVAKRLALNGFKADFIIGDLPQQRRLQVLKKFKANVASAAGTGTVSVLVATDVAARGIDVEDLAMVVNYDLPNEAENYVHRIGRTARAGKSGVAYSFCSEQDVYNLPAIERYIDMSIPARVAEAELMAEDKSAGVYIRTEDWDTHEDERGERESRYRRDDRHGGYRRDDRRMDKERRGDRRSKGTNRRDDKRGQGRKTSDSRAANGASRRNDGKTIVVRFDKGAPKRMERPVIDTKSLENMSFEERMRVYKEKYRGKGQERKSRNPVIAKHEVPKQPRVAASPAAVPYEPPVPPVPPKKVPEVVPPAAEKKSLLARVRSLFGKKTRGK